MVEELFAFIAGLALGAFIIISYTTPDTNVESGKIFKVNDATYQCKQLNKLIYGDQKNGW